MKLLFIAGIAIMSANASFTGEIKHISDSAKRTFDDADQFVNKKLKPGLDKYVPIAKKVVADMKHETENVIDKLKAESKKVVKSV